VFGAGSGVVIDSDPAQEISRVPCCKAKFLSGPCIASPRRSVKTLPVVSQPDKFSLIETMLWNGSYPLLELHLTGSMTQPCISVSRAIEPQ